MKKSIKILALILTLALVCGVFVIGAFAADEAARIGYDYANREAVDGESLIFYMDYEALDVVDYDNAKDIASDPQGFTNDGKNFGLIYKGRQGQASIVKAVKGAANKYLVITMGDSVAAANQNPYATYRLQADADNVSKFNGHWSMGDVSYLVFDTDVYFPGTLSGTPNINFQFRGYDKTGARTYTQNVGIDTNSVNWQFKTVGGNYTVNDAVMNKTGWNHITGIVESIVSVDDEGYEYLTFKVYTVVNGVLGGTVKTFSNFGADRSLSYDNDRTGIYSFEARLQFGNATDGTQILNDNFAARMFDKTYDGNLAELLAAGAGTDMTEWDANVYDIDLLPYGKTVATREVDGEIVEYDNLQKAINAAEEEETITLTTNIGTKVFVDKPLTIDGTDKGYTCDIATAEGFSSKHEENVYYIETATDGLTVIWYACDCGNDCFEEAEFVVYEGNNIYDAYYAATGKRPVCNPVEDADTHTKTNLVGFADVSGLIENFTADTVVTEDMIGETIELEPVYETLTPVGMKIVASTGAETYYYDEASFIAMFANVGAGNTIKLLSNIEINQTVSFGANSTLDLNGYRIASLQDKDTAKRALFSAGGRIVNVCSTSEKSVGTIYHAKYDAGKKSWIGDPVFNAGSNGTVNFFGADANGKTTIRVYTAVLFNDWASNTNYNIDGGEYYRTASDHEGFIYARGTGTGTFKNAYIYGGATAFAFCGVNTVSGASLTGKTGTYTIDNCVIEVTSAISNCTYSGLSVTFTNSYLNGAMNPTKQLNATVLAATGVTHTIGEGCFIKAGVEIGNVNYAGTVYPVNLIKTVEDTRNDFMADDVFAVTTTEISTTYDKMVGPAGLEEIEVIWVDTKGDELGRTMAFPGLETSAPAFPVAGTNGMVMQTYADWVGGTYVPLTAEDGYTFTLAEGSDVLYTAGVIDIKFNFDMINHIQYNFYIPEAPEGISYVKVLCAQNAYPFGNWNFANSFTSVDENGVKYTKANAWPSIQNTDTDYQFQVVFTYQGQELTYMAPKVSLAKYTNYILEAEKYTEYDEIKTVVADLMRMIKQANIAAKQTTDATFEEVYAKAEAYMTNTANVIDPNATNDFTSVSAYLDDVKLAFVSGLGSLTVGVKAKDGYVAIMAGKDRVHGQNAIGDNRNIDSTGYIYAHNVRTYAMNEIIVISFYNAADTTLNGQVVTANKDTTPVATFEFTMAGLVNDNADTYDEATKALVDSVFGYAYSAGKYMDWRSENLHKA